LVLIPARRDHRRRDSQHRLGDETRGERVGAAARACRCSERDVGLVRGDLDGMDENSVERSRDGLVIESID
jgi:hypothetical protein